MNHSHLLSALNTNLLTQATGEFEDAGGGKPNDLAAIQVSPTSPDWILAKVISHDTATGMYTLSDEDTESNKSKTSAIAIFVLLFVYFII